MILVLDCQNLSIRGRDEEGEIICNSNAAEIYPLEQLRLTVTS
jgi:hypothetical protein